MSIISDALKKAQQQRIEDRTLDVRDPAGYNTHETYDGRGNTDIIKTSWTGRERIVRLTLAGGVSIALLGVLALGISLFGNRIVPGESGKDTGTPAVRTAGATPDVTTGHALAERPLPGQPLSSGTRTIAEIPLERPIPRKLPDLSGIMYSPTNPQAILNGIVVSEGEQVAGTTVLKIYPDGVRVLCDEGVFEIKLR